MSIKPRFIISDLHFGDGQSPLEDFDSQCAENFLAFFDEVSALGGVKVIINGDFIDFPQIPLPQDTPPPPSQFLGTTEAESMFRLQQVFAGHTEEFDALKRFLKRKGNELLLIAGNHDIDFCWNGVLKQFRQHIGANDENFHFGMVYKEAGVYVSHGHQYSHENRIDVPIDFTYNRLNSCWGTQFVEQFFNHVEARYPLLDNARPTWKVALSAILHEELLATAQFAATFFMFYKKFGTPLQEYHDSGFVGWKPKTRAVHNIDTLISDVALEALRERLQSLRTDTQFRQDFDAAFDNLDDRQWERLCEQLPTASRMTQEFLQTEEPEGSSRSLFAKTDNYREAAKLIATYHPDTHTVVMGHTHVGLGAQQLQTEDREKSFEYFNTGTWTKTYDIPWWQLPRLEKLATSSLFTPNCGVVRCTGTDDHPNVRYYDSWKNAISDDVL